MDLLVVPLAPHETHLLTFGEWEALTARAQVVFDVPDHPLAGRLKDAGVEVSVVEGKPDVEAHGAFVLDPRSEHLDALAAAGARITAGAAVPPDALAAVRGAPVARRAQASLGALTLTMARLRGRDGCPWDAQQTHGSLQTHLLEEAHEVLEAIDRGTVGAELEEELGDLLLQVLFHARLAEDDDRFDIASVADGIVTKLIRRHPHVFGDVQVADAGEVLQNWEQIKRTEKKRESTFEDLPVGLPALLLATKAQKRARRDGFEPSAEEVNHRIAEALQNEEPDAAIGEALFWVVAAARATGIDAEGALRRAVLRFTTG